VYAASYSSANLLASQSSVTRRCPFRIATVSASVSPSSSSRSIIAHRSFDPRRRCASPPPVTCFEGSNCDLASERKSYPSSAPRSSSEMTAVGTVTFSKDAKNRKRVGASEIRNYSSI
jgi:hypothetical protein